MILPRAQLPILLNALYETDKRDVTVKHPCSELDELLRFSLAEPFASPVRFTQSLAEYAESREEVGRKHGEAARDDLPDDSSFVRCVVASGVLDIENREEVESFVKRYGYPDLEAGHTPVVVGIDANIMPWRVGELLDIDHRTGARDERDRTATNGYALATGVKSELDWYYKQYETESLVDAFGDDYERLDNQPAGANREGFLGLYEYRRLMAERNVDIVECGEGDAAIVDGYRQFNRESRKEAILFSNDFGFIERAGERGVPAQHVDFPRRFPRKVTATWDELVDLLYFLAIRFGVIRLPGVTLYGVWNGKDGSHWQEEAVVVDPRSPKLDPLFERDRAILDAFDQS